LYSTIDREIKGEKIMANENPNPLFGYVEARIAAWQAVLASLKAALSLDPSGKAGEGIDLSSIAGAGNGEIGQPIDLPDGAFFGKSVPACVKLYLSAARKKKTSKEITAALREGGVESTSGNFENIVTTALNRLRIAGEVLKFKDGWGLSEWYPANMRTSGSAGKRVPKGKKKSKKGKVKRATSTASAATIRKVTEIRKPEDKPEPRILAFFKGNHREVAASEVATALGLKIQTAHLVLAKLAHQKKIEKLSSGHFKALGAVAS
jgi:hypothetical protein